ncbi:MAG: VanZ family protein [Candidatus Zixiibacteriota bacterium]|nr:MAG: VanZ family protein [candidate division Zixibacteria bacterium]
MLLLALKYTRIPNSDFLLKEINNLKHIPFFGILSLLLLGLITWIFGKIIKKRITHYFIAFVLAVIIGGLSEYQQIAGPRDADVMDFLKDVAGAFSFLASYAIFDRRMELYRNARRGRMKTVIFIAAALSIVLALIPIALKGIACIRRHEISPAICTFDSFWENYYLEASHAKIKKAEIPTGLTGFSIDYIVYIEFDVASYPGFKIEGPFPDWSDYRYLGFMVYSELKDPLILHVRIDDTHYRGTYQDRFNHEFNIIPGLNDIQIPLDDIKHGSVYRELDIDSIKALYIFASYPDKPFGLFIGDIKLR